jgi:hypothetical protein
MTTAKPPTRTSPTSTSTLTKGSTMSPQGWRTRKRRSPQVWSNSCRLSTTLSANITAQGRVHQDLHAPTMGVTMSAIDNLTLKSMVQTIDNILVA